MDSLGAVKATRQRRNQALASGVPKRNAVHRYTVRDARAQRIPPSREHIVLVLLAELRRRPACYGVSAKLTLVALATRMSTGVA
jgi:hypothetical protein